MNNNKHRTRDINLSELILVLMRIEKQHGGDLTPYVCTHCCELPVERIVYHAASVEEETPGYVTIEGM